MYTYYLATNSKYTVDCIFRVSDDEADPKPLEYEYLMDIKIDKPLENNDWELVNWSYTMSLELLCNNQTEFQTVREITPAEIIILAIQ